MRGDSGRQIRERVEVLELTRPHNGQQTLDRAFTLVAPRPEHDLPPLNCRAKGSLGGRMPRAGLCRVGELSPGRFGAHFAADAA